MTQEEYNQLDSDFAHCAGTHCEKAGKCLRHTAYKMLAGNRNETYRMRPLQNFSYNLSFLNILCTFIV